MKTTKLQREILRQDSTSILFDEILDDADEAERLQSIITEAQNLCGAEPGNLLARIIQMNNEIEYTRKRLEAFEDCVRKMYDHANG